MGRYEPSPPSTKELHGIVFKNGNAVNRTSENATTGIR